MTDHQSRPPGRVLLIGNSHLAAPRTALRDFASRWPGFKPDVFGLPGQSIGELICREGSLVSDQPEIRRQMQFYNDQPSLDIRGYDLFAVIGGGSFSQVCAVQDSHRSLSFPSVQAGVPAELCSEGFIDAMIRQRILGSTAARLIVTLAGQGSAPILYLPGPFPSLDCRNVPGAERPLVALSRRGDGRDFFARYRRILHQELAGRAKLLMQPDDTVTEEIFTDPQWMRGALRLNNRSDIPQGKADHAHANASYGARQIDQILDAISAL